MTNNTQPSLQVPVAYARKWHIDGEVPAKVRNEKNRLVWPTKFKWLPVTPNKILSDDVPLFGPAQSPAASDAGLADDAMNFTAKPQITLSARQLKNALNFIAPDYETDEDQRDAEVSIQYLTERMSVENEPMPAGFYGWDSDYPEEGCVPLDMEDK